MSNTGHAVTPSQPGRSAIQPRTIVLKLVLVIFLTEAVEMAFFLWWKPPWTGGLVLLDAALLTIVCLPALYWLVVQPLRRSADAQRMSEDAYRKLEESYARILADAPIWLWAASPRTHRPTLVSPGVRQVTGYTAHEFTERPSLWYEIIHGDDRERVDQWRKRVWEEKTPGKVEYRIRHRDGRARWIEAVLIPECDADHQIVGVCGFSIDITDRKHAEERLRLTQFAVDRGSDAAFWFQRDARFVYVNDQACRSLGYDRQELLQCRIDDIDADFNAETWPALWEDIREHGSARLESRHRTKDGRIFPVEISANYLEYRGQEYVCAFARDITERRESELAIRTRTEQLAAVGDTMTTFLEQEDWQAASGELLRCAIAQTESEYGFVGTVVPGPAIRILSHQGIRWDRFSGRDFYEQAIARYRDLGYLEFRNLENLFGRVVTERRAIIANDPGADPRSGGLPPGHPPLRHFLGVPIRRGADVVGMIGIANRPGGYDQRDTEKLQVLCHAAGVLFDSYTRRQREEALERERQRDHEELRRKAQFERLLLRELDHRVRNNLASLISLIDVSRRTATDVEALAGSIRGRVQAMAGAHAILSQSSWSSVNLRHLIRALAPPDRRGLLDLEGPDLAVGPRQATALALVIHELLTNSFKHGALKSDLGRIRIAWEADDSQDQGVSLRWDWQESGGPVIEVKPTPGGGSNLIEGLIRSELNGSVELAYPRTGARHRMTMQVDRIATGAAAERPSP